MAECLGQSIRVDMGHLIKPLGNTFLKCHHVVPLTSLLGRAIHLEFLDGLRHVLQGG